MPKSPRHTKPQHLLWQVNAGSGQLAALGKQIAAELGKEPFCLWLEGKMGTGKTTLSGAILHSLGLSPKVPVTSPTYSYLNEYSINNKLFAHMDLYRADPDFALAELGPLASGAYHGLLIEWPQNAQGAEELAATHRLVLAYSDEPAERLYQFFTTKSSRP